MEVDTDCDEERDREDRKARRDCIQMTDRHRENPHARPRIDYGERQKKEQKPFGKKCNESPVVMITRQRVQRKRSQVLEYFLLKMEGLRQTMERKTGWLRCRYRQRWNCHSSPRSLDRRPRAVLGKRRIREKRYWNAKGKGLMAMVKMAGKGKDGKYRVSETLLQIYEVMGW